MKRENKALKNLAITGIQWNLVARVGQQLSNFAMSVILARLLLPDDFGAVGMVAVFVGFANLLADMGFAAALVQRREITDYHIHSIFWLNLGIGLCLTLLLFMSAPFIAAFYKLPLLLSLAQVFSMTFLVSAPGIVPRALLQRRMRFRQLAITSIVSIIFSGCAGVLLAFLGAGVWSLVAQGLIMHLTDTIVNLWWTRWHPKWIFNLKAVREVLRFTLNLFGFNFINYWARNSDSLLIGRHMGTGALGFYGRAYALMLLPINQIVGVLSQVMFPALSAIKEDKVRVKSIYLRAMSVISLLVSPIMMGLAVTAYTFTVVVYGEKWSDLATLIQILTPIGLLQAFMNPVGWLYTSQGRTDWMFWWGMFGAGALIFSIVSGIALGSIETVALSYAAMNILIFYPCIAIPGRLIDMKFREFLASVIVPIFGALIMAALVLFCSTLIHKSVPIELKLVLQVAIGVLTYTIFIAVTRPQGWRELKTILRERVGSRVPFLAVPTALSNE